MDLQRRLSLPPGVTMERRLRPDGEKHDAVYFLPDGTRVRSRRAAWALYKPQDDDQAAGAAARAPRRPTLDAALQRQPERRTLDCDDASDISEYSVHNATCTRCLEGGEVLCCDHCNLVWHPGCLRQPPPESASQWACPTCNRMEELASRGGTTTHRSCHWCRRKCERDCKTCYGCGLRFCGECITRHDNPVASSLDSWLCMVCRDCCECLKCLARVGPAARAKSPERHQLRDTPPRASGGGRGHDERGAQSQGSSSWRGLMAAAAQAEAGSGSERAPRITTGASPAPGASAGKRTGKGGRGEGASEAVQGHDNIAFMSQVRKLLVVNWCHRCHRNKHVAVQCQRSGCNQFFCKACLTQHFGTSPEGVAPALLRGGWQCFRCQGTCNCTKCKRHDPEVAQSAQAADAEAAAAWQGSDAGQTGGAGSAPASAHADVARKAVLPNGLRVRIQYRGEAPAGAAAPAMPAGAVSPPRKRETPARRRGDTRARLASGAEEGSELGQRMDTDDEEVGGGKLRGTNGEAAAPADNEEAEGGEGEPDEAADDANEGEDDGGSEARRAGSDGEEEVDDSISNADSKQVSMERPDAPRENYRWVEDMNKAPACHMCHKRRVPAVGCTRDKCGRYFCRLCVDVRYEAAMANIGTDGPWACFVCTETCGCRDCQKRLAKRRRVDGAPRAKAKSSPHSPGARAPTSASAGAAADARGDVADVAGASVVRSDRVKKRQRVTVRTPVARTPVARTPGASTPSAEAQPARKRQRTDGSMPPPATPTNVVSPAPTSAEGGKRGGKGGVAVETLAVAAAGNSAAGAAASSVAARGASRPLAAFVASGSVVGLVTGDASAHAATVRAAAHEGAEARALGVDASVWRDDAQCPAWLARWYTAASAADAPDCQPYPPRLLPVAMAHAQSGAVTAAQQWLLHLHKWLQNERALPLQPQLQQPGRGGGSGGSGGGGGGGSGSGSGAVSVAQLLDRAGFSVHQLLQAANTRPRLKPVLQCIAQLPLPCPGGPDEPVSAAWAFPASEVEEAAAAAEEQREGESREEAAAAARVRGGASPATRRAVAARRMSTRRDAYPLRARAAGKANGAAAAASARDPAAEAAAAAHEAAARRRAMAQRLASLPVSVKIEDALAAPPCSLVRQLCAGAPPSPAAGVVAALDELLDGSTLSAPAAALHSLGGLPAFVAALLQYAHVRVQVARAAQRVRVQAELVPGVAGLATAATQHYEAAVDRWLRCLCFGRFVSLGDAADAAGAWIRSQTAQLLQAGPMLHSRLLAPACFQLLRWRAVTDEALRTLLGSLELRRCVQGAVEAEQLRALAAACQELPAALQPDAAVGGLGLAAVVRAAERARWRLHLASMARALPPEPAAAALREVPPPAAPACTAAGTAAGGVAVLLRILTVDAAASVPVAERLMDTSDSGGSSGSSGGNGGSGGDGGSGSSGGNGGHDGGGGGGSVSADGGDNASRSSSVGCSAAPEPASVPSTSPPTVVTRPAVNGAGRAAPPPSLLPRSNGVIGPTHASTALPWCPGAADAQPWPPASSAHASAALQPEPLTCTQMWPAMDGDEVLALAHLRAQCAGGAATPLSCSLAALSVLREAVDDAALARAVRVGEELAGALRAPATVHPRAVLAVSLVAFTARAWARCMTAADSAPLHQLCCIAVTHATVRQHIEARRAVIMLAGSAAQAGLVGVTHAEEAAAVVPLPESSSAWFEGVWIADGLGTLAARPPHFVVLAAASAPDVLVMLQHLWEAVQLRHPGCAELKTVLCVVAPHVEAEGTQDAFACAEGVRFSMLGVLPQADTVVRTAELPVCVEERV